MQRCYHFSTHSWELRNLNRNWTGLQSHFDINIRPGESEIEKKILQKLILLLCIHVGGVQGRVNVGIERQFWWTLFLKYQKEKQVNAISREQSCFLQQTRHQNISWLKSKLLSGWNWGGPGFKKNDCQVWPTFPSEWGQWVTINHHQNYLSHRNPCEVQYEHWNLLEFLLLRTWDTLLTDCFTKDIKWIL